MKLCVLQGTFNPIHNAHLSMAEYALNKYNFDKILFIPAFKPPHKKYEPDLCYHRLKMVELATKYNSKFEVSDIEYQNDRTSYTYITIKELYKKYSIDGKINFIIGTDAYQKIDTWYEADNLKKIINFIVFTREKEPVGNCFTKADMEFQDISSTKIRDNIKNNISIDNLVPKVIEEYIKEHGLYKN